MYPPCDTHTHLTSLWPSFVFMNQWLCLTQTDSGCGRPAQVYFCWFVIPVVLCTWSTNGRPWITPSNQLSHPSYISSYAAWLTTANFDDEMCCKRTSSNLKCTPNEASVRWRLNAFSPLDNTGIWTFCVDFRLSRLSIVQALHQNAGKKILKV